MRNYSRARHSRSRARKIRHCVSVVIRHCVSVVAVPSLSASVARSHTERECARVSDAACACATVGFELAVLVGRARWCALEPLAHAALVRSETSSRDNSVSVQYLREQAEPPRNVVVHAGVGGWVEALVEVLHLARIDAQRFVVSITDHFPVTDVVGPVSPIEGHVGGRGEGRRKGICQRSPGAVERVGRPRAEVAMRARANVVRFDQKRYLSIPFNLYTLLASYKWLALVSFMTTTGSPNPFGKSSLAV